MRQAKANARKIEDYKLKLRQSSMGGLVTNDLKSKLERLQREKRTEQERNPSHEESKAAPAVEADLESYAGATD